MITPEEFRSIQVGDRVKIVSKWHSFSCQNSMGAMDGFLGQTVTVDSIAGNLIRISENRRWKWNRYCIAEIIKREYEVATNEDLNCFLSI